MGSLHPRRQSQLIDQRQINAGGIEAGAADRHQMSDGSHRQGCIGKGGATCFQCQACSLVMKDPHPLSRGWAAVAVEGHTVEKRGLTLVFGDQHTASAAHATALVDAVQQRQWRARRVADVAGQDDRVIEADAARGNSCADAVQGQRHG